VVLMSPDGPVPRWQDGKFNFDRHFDPPTLARLAADYSDLTEVEAEILRHAYREAAAHSLTVLNVDHKGWSDVGDMGRVYAVRMSVRWEPQTNERLIYEVAARISRDPDLWAVGRPPSPYDLAEAAVRAVRDLGRLAAVNGRPDGIPE